MRIRRENGPILNDKSESLRSSVKKRFASSISKSIDSTTTTAFVTPTMTPSDAKPYDDDHYSEKTNQFPTVPMLISFATMFCLMLVAIYFGIHLKRKLNEDSIHTTDHTKNTGESVDRGTDTELEIREIESQRSSVSSFLAIEVMTNTLSNIIKQQGGKIEVPGPTDTIFTKELVKVKSLELSNEERFYRNNSKGENGFKGLIKNVFGKGSSTLKNDKNNNL